MIDTIKGTLEFEGLGPDKIWTIKNARKGVFPIWPIFSEIISNRYSSRAAIRIGNEHIILKRPSGYGSYGVELDKKELASFLRGTEVYDGYILKIMFYFTLMLSLLNGKEVRLSGDLSEFKIMSIDLFERLKSEKKLHLAGLYKDHYGFCPIISGHQKKFCRIGETDQCTFAVSFFDKNTSGIYVEKFLCARSSKEFSKIDPAIIKKMHRCDCDPPRGSEI